MRENRLTESLLDMIKEEAGKGDSIVGICYRSCSQY